MWYLQSKSVNSWKCWSEYNSASSDSTNLSMQAKFRYFAMHTYTHTHTLMSFNSSFSTQLYVNMFRMVAQWALYKTVHCPDDSWNALVNVGLARVMTVNVMTVCLRVTTVWVWPSVHRSWFLAKRLEVSYCTVPLWRQYPFSTYHCLLGEEIAFFSDVRQRWLAVTYRRFGTPCRSHFKGPQLICSKFEGHRLSILSTLASN
jgi:hypothetical protein